MIDRQKRIWEKYGVVVLSTLFSIMGSLSGAWLAMNVKLSNHETRIEALECTSKAKVDLRAHDELVQYVKEMRNENNMAHDKILERYDQIMTLLVTQNRKDMARR